ncbi:hypothetical protein CW751_12245 [Brumimicrobium salinarum]|uniref:Uncharacterized protein n=1 Tax=Brumimicrobium salinarum TaxID=2058658 RepID=A0A2I0R096_9FLAO|nr:hypothetical protein [Brumimicrobium salinarum]PKR79989.1 hypothetical protein CW751_12245 [Brumimicrobium salinarum]
MRLLNLGLFASILFFGISCSNSQKVEAKASDATMNDSKKSELHPIIESVDFYAKNEEQGWKLSIIYDEQIVFTDTKNEISYVSKNLVKNVAQGANVIQISSQNETHLINVNIDIVDCMKSGKKINIMLRKIDAKKGNDYSGCGFYRGTPQLHDIWALHSINGKEIKAEQFPKELPHFEFNLTTKK